MHADDGTDHRFEMALDALRQTLNPLQDAKDMLACNCGTVCQQTCSHVLAEAAISRVYSFISTWERNSRMDRLWEQMRSFAKGLPFVQPLSGFNTPLMRLVNVIRLHTPYKDFEAQLATNLDSAHQAYNLLAVAVYQHSIRTPAETCILVLALNEQRSIPRVNELLLKMGGLRGAHHLEPACSLAHLLNEQIAYKSFPVEEAPTPADHNADFEASMNILDGMGIPRTTAEGHPISLAVRITLLHKKNAEDTDYVDPLSGRAFTPLEQRMR